MILATVFDRSITEDTDLLDGVAAEAVRHDADQARRMPRTRVFFVGGSESSEP
ncbi:hypothetical protein [Streptomyces vinaceus]|uniref:hypothetical protein n=1 Tax=Streptomyces vinaceus TaxID=1960 RepID=UPI0035DD21D5